MSALFQDFLNNHQEYLACQEYWSQLIGRAARSHGQNPEEWARWIAASVDENGHAEWDGNPIYDGFSRQLNRAFRVIQHPYQLGEGLGISAWLSTYPDYAVHLPANELVLNLSLSENTARLASTALDLWADPKTSPQEMQDHIDHNFPEWTGIP